jgi:hypothetical protein
MKMMDAADARWSTYLLTWFLSELHALARRRRMHRQRSMWMVLRRHNYVLVKALLSWHDKARINKRLSNVGGCIKSKHDLALRERSMACWMRATARGKILGAAAKYVMRKRTRKNASRSFSWWLAATKQSKVSAALFVGMPPSREGDGPQHRQRALHCPRAHIMVWFMHARDGI